MRRGCCLHDFCPNVLRTWLRWLARGAPAFSPSTRHVDVCEDDEREPCVGSFELYEDV